MGWEHFSSEVSEEYKALSKTIARIRSCQNFKCLGSRIELTKTPQLPLICKIVLDLTGQLLWTCLSTLASATTRTFFAIFADPYTPYLTYTKTFNICINLEPVDNSRKLFDAFQENCFRTFDKIYSKNTYQASKWSMCQKSISVRTYLTGSHLVKCSRWQNLSQYV